MSKEETIGLRLTEAEARNVTAALAIAKVNWDRDTPELLYGIALRIIDESIAMGWIKQAEDFN